MSESIFTTSQQASLRESLEEFAASFDPPFKVIRHKAKGHSSGYFFCIHAPDGEQMSFKYIDGCQCGDGCFFNEHSRWSDLQRMFAHGGTLHYVQQLAPDTFRSVTCYKVPAFKSMSELKMKLAIIGPQVPAEKVDAYAIPEDNTRDEI